LAMAHENCRDSGARHRAEKTQAACRGPNVTLEGLRFSFGGKGLRVSVGPGRVNPPEGGLGLGDYAHGFMRGPPGRGRAFRLTATRGTTLASLGRGKGRKPGVGQGAPGPGQGAKTNIPAAMADPRGTGGHQWGVGTHRGPRPAGGGHRPPEGAGCLFGQGQGAELRGAGAWGLSCRKKGGVFRRGGNLVFGRRGAKAPGAAALRPKRAVGQAPAGHGGGRP